MREEHEEVPFISYAQFGEDVVLWRALGDTADGRYVDVGAFHPTVDSVTRAFYERGWCGINIDPDADAMQRFTADRPRDINLVVAAGEEDGGELTFFESSVPGWSTTDQTAATRLADEGRLRGRTTVPVRRLSSILEEHDFDRVDFLKVDVEGAERQVLAGLDLERHRPRVIVLEGASPGMDVGYADEAVQRLVANGYRHVRWDGLNHYLTLDPALVEALDLPAGPLDRYARHRETELAVQVQVLSDDLDRASQRHAEERLRVDQLRHDLDVTNRDLQLVLTSRSWRLTAPLRNLGAPAKRLARPGRKAGGAVWRLVRPLLVALADRMPGTARRVLSLRGRIANARKATTADPDVERQRRERAARALQLRARLRARS